MVNSLFEIIGPIMAGPSSSHTAGAAKIGNMARSFVQGDVVTVKFLLHGSFAQTYKGHGTDKALLGGILGLAASSPQLKFAYRLAEDMGVTYEFLPVDLGDVHPNTVKVIVTSSTGKITEVVGASVGGGAVRLTEINGIKMNLSGQFPTIVTHHIDRRGILTLITRYLAENQINIATVNLYRSQKGKDAFMIIETDEDFEARVIEGLRQEVDDLIDVFVIK